MKNKFILTFIVSLFISISLYSQEDMQLSETDSSVPELFAFHEVIYPIWHTAYPEKNFTMLKELIPDVNSGAEKIYSAKLPGILRDKENEWKTGIAEFRSSVEKYNETMKESDETAMLNAAEELHSSYEKLVRVIKPVTKEIDEFHKVLYMIYHHYWPNRDMEKFNKAVDDLQMRAVELNNCVLPKWASDKSEEFKTQSEKLFESTKNLKELKDKKVEESMIDKAVENVHSDYAALEGLF